MALRVIGKTNYDLVEEWLESLSIADISRVEYRRRIRRWFNFLARQKYDADLPEERYVVEFRRSLDGHSPYYINCLVNVVRQFYSWCFQMRYCTTPVGASVRSLKLHFRYNKLPLSDGQIKMLLAALEHPKTLRERRDQVMIYLMLFNGLRCVEVSRMTFADVERYDQYDIIRIQPKGHTQKDEVRRLPDLTVAAIEDYASALAEKYDNVDALPVAVSFTGRLKGKPLPLSAHQVSRVVARILKRMGFSALHKITPHSLRHSYACLLLENGVSIEEVQAQLGHSNPQLTQLYAAMIIDKKKLESDATNRIIQSLVNERQQARL